MYLFEIYISGNYTFFHCNNVEAHAHIHQYYHSEDRIFFISNVLNDLTFSIADNITENFNKHHSMRVISCIVMF